MSAFYPPSYSFTGINFNSGFFTTPTTGLTETQANDIYLRKTTPDTASALETFTGGIKTDTINATNPANILTLGTLSASTTVSSNLQVDVAINTPSLYTYFVDVENIATPLSLTIGDTFCTAIDIGAVAKPTNIKGALNNTGQIFPNGGLDTAAGSALNIGTTASKTGAINIGTGASRTGVIHIGDGNSVSGGIHIGNGTSASNNVNILNGATSTGSVNIGNNTSGTITIGGTGAMTLKGAITASTSLTSTGLITANGGLTMGTGKNITLQPNSGYVVPETTTWSQIGSIKVGTISASGTTIISGTSNIGNITLGAGVWIINAYCGVSPAGITTDNLGIRYSINTTSAVLSTTYLLMGSEGTTYTTISNLPTIAGTAIISNTASTTYYLNATIAYTIGSCTLGTVSHWNAVRIA